MLSLLCDETAKSQLQSLAYAGCILDQPESLIEEGLIAVGTPAQVRNCLRCFHLQHVASVIRNPAKLLLHDALVQFVVAKRPESHEDGLGAINTNDTNSLVPPKMGYAELHHIGFHVNRTEVRKRLGESRCAKL